MTHAAARRRGRPPGGGNSPEQARRALVVAAESCFAERGIDVTMAELAARAGVTRAVLYRHFNGRDELVEAVAAAVMDRYVAHLVERLMPTDDVSELITESLVFVTSEVAEDPVLTVLASGTEHGVASLLANSDVLGAKVIRLYEQLFAVFTTSLRPGLQPGDAGRHVLSVALALLMRAVPESGDAQTIRRYVRTFVLPSLVTDPPAPERVFS